MNEQVWKSFLLGENYELEPGGCIRAIESSLMKIIPRTQRDKIHLENAKFHLRNLKRLMRVENSDDEK